ncbi:hypothetical protein [Fuerstiella marisgermanici]|uniref:Uncharacterized protein n=1 Tax=Fuerstiella marisgermanici TaxID=1891926 RepID=A0A1P8WB44_9PLAN|nr:hypothetical protein [Fuerstiella marisgermanici]APZ91253.1 hypothetical protein Fuma_00839 [Fuerstiella marisgermanici]
MNRWYRQSLPGRAGAYLLLTIVLLTDVFAVISWFTWGHGLEASDQYLCWLPFVGFNVGLCVIAGMIVAGYRLQGFPDRTASTSFHSWLAATPWQPSSRTPFGPWHPVWLDVVPFSILGVVAATQAAVLCPSLVAARDQAMAWSDALIVTVVPAALAPAVVFLFTWTICAYGILCSRWNWSIFLPALWMGILIHVGKLTSAEIAFSTLGVSLVGLMVVSWRRMQLELTKVPEFHTALSDVAPKPRRTSTTYAALSPAPQNPQFAAGLHGLRPKAFAAGLLLFVWVALLPWGSGSVNYLTVALALFILAVFRMAAYGEILTSHLGLVARWSTRQFIVPSYDRVWIPSVVMIVAGLATYGLVPLGVLPPTLGGALSIAVPVVIGLAMGPDYTTWSLTAPCRYSKRQQQQ